MDDTYKIVFSGEIIGQDVDIVQKKVAALFKVPSDKITPWFSGKPVIIKKGVDYNTAIKIKSVLEQVGAICTIEPLQSSQVPQKIVTSHDQLVYEKRIIALLENSKIGNSYYAANMIPEKKRQNVLKFYNLPENDEILALIDCTVFGSAKEGIVFGKHNLVWKRGSAKAQSLTYHQLLHAQLKNKDKTTVIVEWSSPTQEPPLEISVLGSNIPSENFLYLLQKIISLIAESSLSFRELLQPLELHEDLCEIFSHYPIDAQITVLVNIPYIVEQLELLPEDFWGLFTDFEWINNGLFVFWDFVFSHLNDTYFKLVLFYCVQALLITQQELEEETTIIGFTVTPDYNFLFFFEQVFMYFHNNAQEGPRWGLWRYSDLASLYMERTDEEASLARIVWLIRPNMTSTLQPIAFADIRLNDYFVEQFQEIQSRIPEPIDLNPSVMLVRDK